MTKLLENRLIRKVQYPNWLANTIVVHKKNRKMKVCINFIDLNKAYLKDSFLLPHIDRMVDANIGHKLLSFMDAFLKYNQILMHPEVREKTTFIFEKGTYCYKVMLFGLKNVGAIYQRLVNKMFKGLLRRIREVCIDDMLVKSLKANDHIKHLKEYFEVLEKHNMKLNPVKCSFGVGFGKFLSFLVTKRGIKMTPKQIKAFKNLPLSKILKDIQKLTCRVATLNRFISQSSDKCLLFFNLLKGNKKVF